MDLDSLNWLVTNASGKVVLETLGSGKSLSDVLRTLTEDRSFSITTEELVGFLSEAMKSNILSKSPHAKIARSVEESRLETLFLYVTNACNLRCVHCFQSSRDPLPLELNISEMRSVIRQFASGGGATVIFSGGEPFMRRDLPQLLREASEQGLRIWLTTNGTLIGNKSKMLATSEVHVQVSLDGASEISNDAVRGKGAFRRVVSAIRGLCNAGVDTGLAVVLTKRVCNEIPAVFSLASSLGLSRIQFQQLVRIGRASESPIELFPSFDELVQAYDRICNLSKQVGIQVSLFNSIEEQLTDVIPFQRCRAGISRLSITANGDIYPCPVLHSQEMLCGNVRESNIAGVLKHSKVLRYLRSLSVLDIPECSNCRWRFLCAGGCRGETLATSKTLLARSPSCKFFAYTIEKYGIARLVESYVAHRFGRRKNDRAR